MVVGLDIVKFFFPVERAGWELDRTGGHSLVDLVDPDSVSAHLIGIDLYAHGIFLRAEDDNLSHAVHHGNALSHQSLSKLVDGAHLERLRRYLQVEDRLVRRIDLAIKGTSRHGRQQRQGGGDGRLHVLSGRVDIAAQIELQRDTGCTKRAGGIHGVDTGYR